MQKANQVVNQIFWGTLLREFRASQKNTILDKGIGSSVFMQQLDQELIKRISQRGKTSLTEVLLKQLAPGGRRRSDPAPALRRAPEIEGPDNG